MPTVKRSFLKLPNGSFIQKYTFTPKEPPPRVEPFFPAGAQRYFKGAYYRGGTSRGIMIQPDDLPRNNSQWPNIFKQVIGSPDPYGRQLDGMGAGISSLSKICLVERCWKPGRPLGSIDYTFVGMGIKDGEIDVSGNCGNMLSAVGPYAYNAGLLHKKQYSPDPHEVTVTIKNTNTGQVIKSTFLAAHDAPLPGDSTVDGVAGSSSPIKLEFLTPYGSKTGKLLPTDTAKQMILGARVSCVDGATPCVFINAEDLEIEGTILPDELNQREDILNKLEKTRRAAAVEMGLASTEATVARTLPKIGIVSKPKTHTVLSGQTIYPQDVDMVVRFISDGQPHRAIPLTAALTTAVAAGVEGSVVASLLETAEQSEAGAASDIIRIGHSSGTIEVSAYLQKDKKGQFAAKRATVWRTARRILEGKFYYTAAENTAGQELDNGVERVDLTEMGLGERFVVETRINEAIKAD